MRRTLLFLPGNNPGNVQNGGIFGADGIILDLEDAVSPSEKDSARNLVANALRNIHYGTCEKVVRINPVSYTHLDVYKRQFLDFLQNFISGMSAVTHTSYGSLLTKETGTALSS